MAVLLLLGVHDQAGLEGLLQRSNTCLAYIRHWVRPTALASRRKANVLAEFAFPRVKHEAVTGPKSFVLLLRTQHVASALSLPLSRQALLLLLSAEGVHIRGGTSSHGFWCPAQSSFSWAAASPVCTDLLLQWETLTFVSTLVSGSATRLEILIFWGKEAPPYLRGAVFSSASQIQLFQTACTSEETK